jgi:hypothetical protein
MKYICLSVFLRGVGALFQSDGIPQMMRPINALQRTRRERAVAIGAFRGPGC